MEIHGVRSALECLAILQERSASWKSSDEDRIVFRGEWRKYPSIVTSLSRHSEAQHPLFKVLVSNLALNLYETHIVPVVDVTADGPFYKGKWLGDLNEAEKYLSNPSFLWVHWQMEALLQHYGWPTHWLDVTFDPRVALFFASLDYRAGQLASHERGYVHVWSLSRLRAHAGYFNTPVVDLQPISSILADVFSVPITRPGAQAAAAMRIPADDSHAARHLLESRAAFFEFERSDAASVLDSVATYFPTDVVFSKLESFERDYLELWKSRAASDSDPHVQRFVDFMGEWRNMKASQTLRTG